MPVLFAVKNYFFFFFFCNEQILQVSFYRKIKCCEVKWAGVALHPQKMHLERLRAKCQLKNKCLKNWQKVSISFFKKRKSFWDLEMFNIFTVPMNQYSIRECSGFDHCPQQKSTLYHITRHYMHRSTHTCNRNWGFRRQSSFLLHSLVIVALACFFLLFLILFTVH